MATIDLDGSILRVRMGALEQVGALRRSWSVPIHALRSARWSDDLWREARGWRLGTGIPRTILLGSTHHRDGRDFVAIYGGSGVILEFDKRAPYRRALISGGNESIVRDLAPHAG